MNRYINNIHINKVRHLRDINIRLEKEDYPHLMLTGKNGSGKTSLLNAIANHIERIANDRHKYFENFERNIEYFEKQLKDNSKNILSIEKDLEYWKSQYELFFGEVIVAFKDVDSLIRKYQDGNFIIAFYEAHRTIKNLQEPKNPTKPELQDKWGIKQTSTQEFLKFLAHLKVQEALARNEKLEKDANEIREWFVNFERLLGEIFQDKDLQLHFNYKDYSFKILTKGKEFKFTELSDGFAAVLDIVVDLILKMQHKNQLTRAYECEGIVLVDEIETHLHLELQKVIMPLLTEIFPNIQFIVTTHSPFVLSSLSNAVAFDLEHQEIIEDLTEYSYESLAEGYFGVKTASSYMGMQLGRLEELLKKEVLSLSEKTELKDLICDFDKIPEVVSPKIIGKYLQLKNQHFAKINAL
ncbi:AAA family ATPase [Capnocytophaga sp. oral taxon 878]|uniref:AAA family ATPase n=1 Tax=Capnocytophaga sp. oral taxon 878 TaxID=1316596 RepID=UPI000D0373C5|nr:AAA family ATPase [Capnocytophaga sp. oral taxon 878]AVM50862.1 ATPase [Capnocytophaga sp. oral taxon 878]